MYKRQVQNTLLENGFDISSLDAVVGRGGTLKPLLGVVYSVNDKMIDDLINRPNYQHASNLGAIIAKKMADELSIPSFICLLYTSIVSSACSKSEVWTSSSYRSSM